MLSRHGVVFWVMAGLMVATVAVGVSAFADLADDPGDVSAEEAAFGTESVTEVEPELSGPELSEPETDRSEPTIEADDAVAPEAEVDDAEEPAAMEEETDESIEAVAAQPESEAPSSTRVRMKLDVRGEVFAPAGSDAPPVRLPIEVAARFNMSETPLPEGGCLRMYRDASATLRLDGAERITRLAPDARRIRVEVQGTTPSPSLDHAFLSREERDLIDTPFDPILLDRMLAIEPVADKASWPLAADLVAGLLAIDTVESGGLEATLEDVTDGRATVRLVGIVDGAADGVPTHLTVEGVFTTAVRDAGEKTALVGPVASLSVTVGERREASHVAPGFDVEAKMVIARSSAPAVPTDDHDAGEQPTARRQGHGRPGLVWYRDASGRFDLVHDERWRVVEDGAEGLVMRYLDRGALVGQCSITALPRASSQVPPSIAEVERDLTRSLGAQCGAIEHSAASVRSDGVRIVRVVASGKADELPFCWIHTVMTDADGHRLAVMVMLEKSMVKRFGEADRELVDGLGLPAISGSGAVETAESEAGAGPREARLPKESRTP